MSEIILDMSEYTDEINIIERLHYETEGRQNIILSMAVTGNNIDNKNYNYYWEEYLVYLKTYNKLKSDFQKKHLSQYNGNWTLDFDTKEVTIIENEE